MRCHNGRARSVGNAGCWCASFLSRARVGICHPEPWHGLVLGPHGPHRMVQGTCRGRIRSEGNRRIHASLRPPRRNLYFRVPGPKFPALKAVGFPSTAIQASGDTSRGPRASALQPESATGGPRGRTRAGRRMRLGTWSAEVMDLLQSVDGGRDADLTGLELQSEEERVVPGLVQVAAREP
jgi:hypothetical protein